MYRNIKIQLSSLFFISLLFAMLLIDAVVVSFWYHTHFEEKVYQLKSFLKLELVKEYVTKEGSLIDVNSVFNNGQYGLARVQVNIARASIENGELIISKKGANADLISIVTEALVTKKEIMRRLNGFAKSSKFSLQAVGVALVLTGKDGNDIAMGAIIDDAETLELIWNKQKIIFVYILLNAIILSTIVFFRVRRFVFDPLDRLVTIAETYQVRADSSMFSQVSEGELGQLTKAMHGMVQRIERDKDSLRDTVYSLAEANKNLQKAHKEVVMAEKMSTVGRLSAGLAHEIGNPLTIVQGYVELLGNDDFSTEEREQFSKRAQSELERIDTLIRRLLTMSRISHTQSETFDLCELVQEVIELLELSVHRKGSVIQLTSEAGPFMIKADRDMIRQVVLNLLLNSLDAIAVNDCDRKSGEINMKINEEISSKTPIVSLEIIDNGEGIPPENLDHIFEPFYTTKEPGKGTGLGLAIAERVVRSVGGSIEVKSSPGQGASFKLNFPASVEQDGNKVKS
ncbi:sensor histidine kinase [Desulfopila aestuarii]|uniref:histidine kinase n=1 Tax=Desulfopila aestuarii DSM 18488 TaxID=1121416 RepID=A0A1M7Y1Q5_9BACT|nr:HAMP domain-containing sensor histidine kinase [Desulfopila aestuarii]SHO45713.1 His Kinase A (phospho-acceptor) domain-containing protein [Desulfopila aestuarii DSM 18488]